MSNEHDWKHPAGGQETLGSVTHPDEFSHLIIYGLADLWSDIDHLWSFCINMVLCFRFFTSATPCTTMTVLLSAWTSTALSVEKEHSLTNKH